MGLCLERLEWKTISTYVITINGTPTIVIGGLSFDKTIYGRGNLTITIDYEDFPSEIQKYDRILITKDAARIYEGYIIDIDFPELRTGEEKIHIKTISSDNSEIANRITINDVFEDTDTKVLVTELVTDYLLAENCTIGSININIFSITRIVYGDRQLDKVLDELAEISGAYWFIDKNRVFYMRTFNITNESVIPEIGNDWGEHITDLLPKKSGGNYRNRQILNGVLQ